MGNTNNTSSCIPSSPSPLFSLPQQLSQLLQPQLHIMPQLQHHIMPQLLIMLQPIQRNTHLPHTLSNTELLMTTPRLTSMPKKPLMAKLPLDLTKSTFPMAVYKL